MTYTEQFSNKVDWTAVFQRTGKFPLDRSDLFSSYEDAVKYAAGDINNPDSRKLCGSSYIGQIITVIENDTVCSYQISTSRNLTQIGGTYNLPIATKDSIGGVKIGGGLDIDEQGFIYADLPVLTNKDIDEITNKIR